MSDDRDQADVPRPLLDAEREALLAILDARAFPGRDELRTQAAAAVVVGFCKCGCASVDLHVDDDLPRASRTPSPIPTEATVLGDDGEPLGGVIVLLDEGRLSLLEVYGYGEPIAAMPPLSRLAIA